MKFQRTLDDGDLVPETRVVESGAAAYDLSGCDSACRGKYRGGGGAVRDSHLADSDQRRAGLGELARDFDSDLECAPGLPRRHRGVAREIAGAGGDASIGHADERVCAGVDLNADVDDANLVAEAAREHADRGSAAGDIAQHL